MWEQRRDGALDGLRGLAAVAVIISHLMWAFFPFTQSGDPAHLRFGWEPYIFDSPAYFMYAGSLNVCIFYVLSGFVLSNKFFEGAGVAYLQRAAAKRYVRLGIPVGAAVMIGYSLIVIGAYPTPDPSLTDTFAWSRYKITPNSLDAILQAIYGSLLLGKTSYDYVLWTIQVEIYGSFFLFAFLALFATNRWCWPIAAATSLVLIAFAPQYGFYYVLFLAGAGLHRLPAWSSRTWVVWPALLLGLYIGSYKANAPMYAPFAAFGASLQDISSVQIHVLVFYNAIGAALIVGAVVHSRLLHYLLSTKLTRWLGRISFSVYLTHSFVLASLGLWTFNHVAGHLTYLKSSLLACLVVLVASLISGEIFQRLFDRPSIRLANRISGVSTSEPSKRPMNIAPSSQPSR